MNSRQALGRRGEAAAANYLIGHGYTILAANVRTPAGEIDLIAEKEGMLVFVEVKSRRNRSFSDPETAISPKKQQHMLAAACAYMEKLAEGIDWRIDALSVDFSQRPPEILHFENISIEAEGT